MEKNKMNKILKNILLIGFAPAIMLASSQSMAVDMMSWSAGTGPDTTATDTYYVDSHDPNSNYYYLAGSNVYQDIYGNSFNAATDVLTTYYGDSFGVFDSPTYEAANYLDYQMFIDDNPDAGSSSGGDTTTDSTTSTGSVAYNADDITGTIQNIQNTAIAVMGAFITLGLTVMFYRKIRGLASRG
jgi:hypothetical protein